MLKSLWCYIAYGSGSATGVLATDNVALGGVSSTQTFGPLFLSPLKPAANPHLPTPNNYLGLVSRTTSGLIFDPISGIFGSFRTGALSWSFELALTDAYLLRLLSQDSLGKISPNLEASPGGWRTSESCPSLSLLSISLGTALPPLSCLLLPMTQIPLIPTMLPLGIFLAQLLWFVQRSRRRRDDSRLDQLRSLQGRHQLRISSLGHSHLLDRSP
jgi:hypothetical protein